MKILLIITGVLLLLFVLFQAYITMSTNNTETQQYKVIEGDKLFEIRLYPSVTMASITSSAKSYKELGNSGFKKLAGYIFGGNEARQQIAMTAPVHMNMADSFSTMSFVMPLSYDKNNLPKPNDPDVVIKTTSEEYVAAIKFGGFASEKSIKEHTDKLKKYLEEKAVSYYGNFRFLGYNPPYQFIGRKNEIIVSVNWK